MTSRDRTVLHKIKKAVFDLRFPDERTAFSIRKRLEEWFNQTIVPLLEEAFDTYAPNDRTLRIDRLEIDLGRIDPELLDEDRIGETILTQLDAALKALPAEEVEPLPAAVSLAEALIGFLESGCWPWHAVFQRVDELEEAIRTLPPTEVRPILTRLLPRLQRRQVQRRLIYQFSARFFEWLIRQLHPETSEEILQAARAVLGALETTESKEALLAVVATLRQDERLPTGTLEHRIRDSARRTFSKEAGMSQTAPDRYSESPSDVFRPREQMVETERLKVEPSPNWSHATETEQVEQSQPQAHAIETEQVEAEELYVRHAGIVLLHPFLVHFFDRLALLDDRKQFVSDDVRVKAIHLLHYLATGAERPEEHQTLLYKVLCGFPVDATLVKELPLNEQEKEEAEGLLVAAIQHWEKLGNTSPAGLREGFLEREGQLTRRENGWKLVVEQRSIDVLLDYLPWSLSIVRLPWMESPLWVDWA